MRVRVASVALLAAALAAAPVSAQEPSLEALREATSRPWLTLGALFQTSVDLGLEDAPASAQVRAARIRIYGTLDGGFSYLLQTNFAGSPALLDARVGWTSSTGLTLHAGRFKTPFSRELLTYAGDLDFIGRSRVVDALAPNRQIGAQAVLRTGDHLSWTVGGFTGSENQTRNEALIGVARVEGSAIAVGGGTLSLAVHAAAGRDAAVAGRVQPVTFEGEGVILGADARLDVGPLMLSGEFIRADWDPVGAADTDAEGVYVTAGWKVTPRHQALVRWDRYRAPGASASDYLVVGFNAWPTSAAQTQVNWKAPIDGSGAPHAVVLAFEIGF